MKKLSRLFLSKTKRPISETCFCGAWLDGIHPVIGPLCPAHIMMGRDKGEDALQQEFRKYRRKWPCIVCQRTVFAQVEDHAMAYGYCREHQPKDACFCGKPNIVTFMELTAPDGYRSLYNICSFHAWLWENDNETFNHEFQIMVKPGFIPGQWRIRPEWWFCKESGCRRITKVLSDKLQESGLVRGYCKKHKPRPRIEFDEAADGVRCLLNFTGAGKRKWVRCEVVKMNARTAWVRLPNGIVIKRKKRFLKAA